MKIGVDLDGVIYDSEKELRVYSELFEILDLKKNTKTDNQELAYQKRFVWTEEEKKQFWNKYHRPILRTANFMPGAKDVLTQLKQDGHELYIVTARGGYDKTVIEETIASLKDHGLDIFTRMHWNSKNKAKICQEEQLDLMIDDSYDNCKAIAEAGIPVIYVKDAPSKEFEHPLAQTLYNWGEIYRYITDKMKK